MKLGCNDLRSQTNIRDPKSFPFLQCFGRAGRAHVKYLSFCLPSQNSNKTGRSLWQLFRKHPGITTICITAATNMSNPSLDSPSSHRCDVHELLALLLDHTITLWIHGISGKIPNCHSSPGHWGEKSCPETSPPLHMTLGGRHIWDVWTYLMFHCFSYNNQYCLVIHWICFLNFNPKCNAVIGTGHKAANKASSCEAWAQLWQPNLQVRIDTLVEMATVHKNGLRVTLAQLHAAEVDRAFWCEARHVQAPIWNTPCKTLPLFNPARHDVLFEKVSIQELQSIIKQHPGSFFWCGRKQLCTVCKTIVQLLSLDHWDLPSTSENTLCLIIYTNPNSQPQTQDSTIQARFISLFLRP